MKRFLISFIIYSVAVLTAAKDYNGYKVYDVSPTKEQIPFVMNWEFTAGIDFWSYGRVDQAFRIMVSPEIESNFLNFLNMNEIRYSIGIENVETVLKSDKITKRSLRLANGLPNFNYYWSYPEMEEIFNRLATNYPNLVELDVIGKSYEDKNIYGVRVSKNEQFGLNPIIFVDAGTHAREWAGIQSAFYFLHQLVENSTIYNDLLDNVDYVFVPVVNPDGYQYSFTEDRLWRKNRHYVNYTCTGIDLNRNYPYMWRYRPGSCQGNNHPGPYALSEPETAALAKYMKSFKTNLRLYLSTHTHGGYVLWPLGFAMDVYIKNHKEHQELGERYANAIFAATGRNYTVGNSADVLYIASGASDDFAIAYGNANFAYTLELPGGGSKGFDYPQDMIHDLVKETFIGYREFSLFIKERFKRI
ncbi:carboxypeptidase B1-like [Chironomus tepperi]|uniref:carboxypeptidase B1-like n=1 Tax=Chironomus tepperi TaxID=113505 RepID=UPI00391F8F1D